MPEAGSASFSARAESRLDRLLADARPGSAARAGRALVALCGARHPRGVSRLPRRARRLPHSGPARRDPGRGQGRGRELRPPLGARSSPRRRATHRSCARFDPRERPAPRTPPASRRAGRAYRGRASPAPRRRDDAGPRARRERGAVGPRRARRGDDPRPAGRRTGARRDPQPARWRRPGRGAAADRAADARLERAGPRPDRARWRRRSW